MKKIVIYVILLLLFGFTSSFAQATKAKTAEKSEATAVLDDPKLSPEEKAMISKAGEENPARIDESMLIDPKLDPKSLPSEKDFGASNAKPSEESMVDPKLTGENVAGHQKESWESGAKPVDDRSQPAGEKVGTIINYRDLPAGGNNQPASDSPQNTLNYRDIQGPREQPTSTIPNK
jgi:hypothetical protein